MTIDEANAVLDDKRPETVETTLDMFNHIDMLISAYVMEDNSRLTQDAYELKTRH